MNLKRLTLAFALLFSASIGSATDLKMERSRAQKILEIVAKDIESNFYDPTLKGLDWKNLVSETDQKIANAQSVSEAYTSLFALINQLDDSHTVFLPPGRAADIRFGFNAKAIGDKVLVYEVTKKGAAESAGLKPGDELLTVNGFNADRRTFRMMMLYLRVLRPVTVMELTYRRGTAEPQKVRIEARVEQKSLVTDLSDGSDIWRLVREEENNEREYRPAWQKYDEVGYLRLREFTYDEADVGQSFLKKTNGPKAAIIDLRGNGGGAEKGLLDLAGFFEPARTVMGQVVSRKGAEPLNVSPKSPNSPIPLIILVDSESASASEMFARHFQREGRAVVVGDRSAGAVNQARLFSHHMGTEIMIFYGVEIAVAKVILPDQEILENKGVTPDQICLPTSADLQDGKDPCLDRAVAIAHDLAKNSAGGKVTPVGK